MTTQKILGIDPGSNITGFGIIESNGLKHRYITCGAIKVTEKDLSLRLQQIFDGIRETIFEFQPDTAAIEQVFMHKNASSALKLGQARGAAIVATSIHTIPIAEYSARQVKQAVVGYGAAQKNQVQQMITRLLNLTQVPQADAADALAIAICHANSHFTLSKLGKIKQLGAVKIRRGRLR